ncbi:leucine-rich repeat-containing protein 45-like [Venturia canescens]|uniref:leucine-rich repeat-containing protein 45-like n=1 Tax=Venturia canescens TaxID=32260 RepID=UPI001C9CB8F6|nr:leucine-rich repeat-containing protein 45-like [Venturia canescens]
MKMLSDCELFVQLCENCNIPAPPEVLEKIKIGSTTGELKLSSMSIVVPICGILARVLASSSTIRKVDLGDCMLLSKGLSSILGALCEGSTVTSLNLKGNNVNGPMVGLLGKIFLHNNTLKQLSLEWNSLGSNLEEFGKFCEGLGMNHNIEELDLRYNQISPHCSEALSKALRMNKSLKSVDLAWNTLGLRGGQFLLEAMRENHGLTKLNLRGNCIPDEIIVAIDELLHKNQVTSLVSQATMNESFSKLSRLHEGKESSRKTLLDDSAGVDLLKLPSATPEVPHETQGVPETFMPATKILENEIKDESCDKKMMIEADKTIVKLNQMLQDRSAAIELLTQEINTRAKDTEAAKSLVEQLENEIKLLKEERESFNVEKSREITELREIREKSDDHWQKEYKKLEENLRDSLAREKELEARVQRYEREVRKITTEMTSLREKTISQTRSYEDLIAKSRIELHRVKREMRERENRHKIELSVLKTSLKENTEGLEDCQAQLQKSRLELRENSDKLSTYRTKITDLEKQNSRLLRIEESYEKLKDEKKIMDEKSHDFQRTIDTLQRQVAKLQGELIEPNRRYELIKDELEQEREKNGRLKLELAEERSRHQEQNSQILILNAQITALNNQINEIQNNHISAIRELDKERKMLKDAISNKERDFNDLKTEEVQRASQLYAAFSKYYLGSIGPNVTL